jgi:hypothetical protein
MTKPLAFLDLVFDNLLHLVTGMIIRNQVPWLNQTYLVVNELTSADVARFAG